MLPVTKKTVPEKTYETKKDGTEIPRNVHNAAFTVSILKKYCNSLVAAYFREKRCLVMPDYIESTEVWLPSAQKDLSGRYDLYRKFALKVQKSVVSDGWELMVIYKGTSKVFRKSVEELHEEIPSRALNWVIHENNFYRFEDLPVSVRRNLEEVYPVWNFDIRAALKEKTDAPDRGNKYRKFKEEIE